VRPHPGGITWARGLVPTPHGPLSVQWQTGTTGGEPSFTLRVTVPTGTRGQIAVPGDANADVRLDGKPVRIGTGPAAARISDGYVVLDGVGAGTHTITVA